MNRLTKSFFGLFLGATIGLGVGLSLKGNSNIQQASAVTNRRINILIHSSSWWHNDSAKIYLTSSAATQPDGTNPFQITPDSDLGTVSYGFTSQDIGGTTYYVLSRVIDVDVIASGDYNNLGILRRNPNNASDDWGSNWTLTPSQVKSNSYNTFVFDDNNNMTTSWGNYWKMTTYSGLTDYTSTSGATKAAYLKSAGYEFVPGDPSVPDGYEFEGWYTEKTFTNKWTSDSRMTADTDLYAKYVKKTANFVDTSGTLGDELTYNTANGQFEGIISVDAVQKFAVRLTTLAGTTDYHALDSYLPSSVAVEDGNYVKIINAGTYIVYFKSDLTMWIQTAEDYLVAYAYAGYFLTNVRCDATGASSPSGWSTVKNRYETAVTDGAKDYIAAFDPSKAEEGDDIAAMLARYQIAIKQHPSLDNFLKSSDGNEIFPAHRLSIGLSVAGNNNAILVIVVIASLGILTAGAYYFFKKSRKSEE